MMPHAWHFASLAEALDAAASSTSGAAFYSARGELNCALSWSALRQRAIATAQRLTNAGFVHGDRLGLIAATEPDFLVTFYACQYAGLVPCPLPFTLYPGGKIPYEQRLAKLLSAAQVAAIISPSTIEACAQAAAKAASVLSGRAVQALSYTELETCAGVANTAALENATLENTPQGAVNPIAYIQYSSGSTAEPKGVVITQQAVCANVQGILQHGLKLRPGDRAFSWLPFYHDMGLVGFVIAPLFAQCNIDYLAPTSFARNPTLWLSLMSAKRSTITYAPGFGYQLAARRFKPETQPIDLSCLRVAGIGGDMIHSAMLEECATLLAPAGFRRSTFQPGYGMAEAVLSISLGDLDSGIEVDRSSPDGRAYVICGRSLPGIELLIVNEAGEPLPERTVGEIWVRGTNVMREYFNNAAATQAVMREGGFMATGDLGYCVDGQLVVTGRAKDLILLRGRNIWPQDVEWAVEQISPLKSGTTAAIGVEIAGEERLLLLVQSGIAEGERTALIQKIDSTLSETFGVNAVIIFLPPRSLPFTSSGKIARAEARRAFLAGEYMTTQAVDHPCASTADFDNAKFTPP